jgi:hypothetical protein
MMVQILWVNNNNKYIKKKTYILNIKMLTDSQIENLSSRMNIPLA